MTKLVLVGTLLAAVSTGPARTTATATADESLVKIGEPSCWQQYFECSVRTDGPVGVYCYEQYVICLQGRIG